MSIAGPLTVWKHGTNGAIAVNTDFTAKTLSLSMSNGAEEVDATTFGDFARDYESSFTNATITVQYKSDTTIFAQMWAIWNGRDTVTFEFGPTGTANGMPKLTGSQIMTAMGLPYNVGGLQVLDVTWRITGAVTPSTYSA